MYPTEKFDLIVELEKYNPTQYQEDTLEQIEKELKIHDSNFYIKESEYDNIYMVELKQNNIKTAKKLTNSGIENRLKFIPIDNVVLTRPERIESKIMKISKKKIKNGDTFTIDCNIRGKKFIRSKEEFIKSLYKKIEKLNGKPDETNPNWVIHIEVLGENTGISVVKYDTD
ncbi:MAG: THUMP domain-containing protein [Methanobacterium sp.]|nr:THUMP domain-containing protein [Methanobacterium sp.]